MDILLYSDVGFQGGGVTRAVGKPRKGIIHERRDNHSQLIQLLSAISTDDTIAEKEVLDDDEAGAYVSPAGEDHLAKWGTPLDIGRSDSPGML